MREFAERSERAFTRLLEASAKNDLAIQELRQDIAGCVAVKTTVDDIKTRQLSQIQESIKMMETNVSTTFNTLDKKFTEGLDTVHVRVAELLQAAPMSGYCMTPPVNNRTADMPSSTHDASS